MVGPFCDSVLRWEETIVFYQNFGIIGTQILTNPPDSCIFWTMWTFSRYRFVETGLVVADVIEKLKREDPSNLFVLLRIRKRTAGWEYDWPLPPRCNSIKFDPIDQAADSLPVITRGRRLIARINHLALITYRYRYFPEVSAIFPLDLRPTRPSLLV